jgi:hypothetical protein
MGLFSKSVSCPVSEDEREWLESCFKWLIQEFDGDKIASAEVKIPDRTHFPFRFDLTEQTVLNVKDRVARYMEIDPEVIDIIFYSEKTLDFGYGYSTQKLDDEKYSAGLYFGKEENGRYTVAIESEQVMLPEGLIAVMAHELSHIKLLGEKRIPENNEYLTDMVPMIFGLGIFVANASFHFSSTAGGGWKMNRKGYLTQAMHGYLLALYACHRREKEPAWLKYLSKDVKAYFKKTNRYIEANQKPSKTLS